MPRPYSPHRNGPKPFRASLWQANEDIGGHNYPRPVPHHLVVDLGWEAIKHVALGRPSAAHGRRRRR